MVSVLLSRIKKKKKHKRNYLNYCNADDNDNDSHSLLQILNFSNQDKKNNPFRHVITAPFKNPGKVTYPQDHEYTALALLTEAYA